MGVDIGILFAFAAMLCCGLGDFFIQKNSRKIGDVQTLLFVGLIGIIGLLPFVWHDIGALFEFRNLVLVLVLGVLTFIGALMNFEALREGKLSIVEVVIEVELPITIILGLVFFRESLSVLQVTTMSLIFVGIILIAFRSGAVKNARKSLEKGVFIGLLSAIGMGFINFFTAASSRTISPFMAVWAPAVLFSFLCLCVIVRREGVRKVISNFTRYRWTLLAMGIFDTLAWTFYALSIHNHNLGLITAITESYPAIGLFLGLWINKERIRTHQYLGAVLALAASFILAFVIS